MGFQVDSERAPRSERKRKFLFPIKTNNRLASLLTVVNRGDGKPVGNVIPIFNDLIQELRAQTGRFAAVLARDLAAFNVEVGRLGLDAVK